MEQIILEDCQKILNYHEDPTKKRKSRRPHMNKHDEITTCNPCISQSTHTDSSNSQQCKPPSRDSLKMPEATRTIIIEEGGEVIEKGNSTLKLPNMQPTIVKFFPSQSPIINPTPRTFNKHNNLKPKSKQPPKLPPQSNLILRYLSNKPIIPPLSLIACSSPRTIMLILIPKI